MKKIRPISGQIYTARQMLSDELELKDSPFFCFKLVVDGEQRDCVLQTAHTTNEQMLSVEAFADSYWEYEYTTSEWIPIFNFTGTEEEIRTFFDIELENQPDYMVGKEPRGYHVTLKGFPQEQYFKTQGQVT